MNCWVCKKKKLDNYQKIIQHLVHLVETHGIPRELIYEWIDNQPKMSEIIQQQDTRREFVNTLNELAEKDKGIIVIIPDVGFNYLNDPNLNFKVLNLGVTEQSSMIIAAALALSGFKPYIYSMIPFITFRVHEMIRNAVCMHKANVKILGVKGSEKYKMLGFSHNLLRENEEVDFLSKLPGMKCYLPKTNEEVKKVILKSYQELGPAYLRL